MLGPNQWPELDGMRQTVNRYYDAIYVQSAIFSDCYFRYVRYVTAETVESCDASASSWG